MKFFGLFDSKNGNNNNEEIEEKQKNVKLLIFGIIGILFTFLILNSDGKKDKNAPNAGNFNIVKEEEAVKTKWLKSAETNLGEQQKQLRETKKELERLRKSIVDLEKRKNIIVKTVTEKNDNVSKKDKYPTPPPSSTKFNIDKYLPSNYKQTKHLVNNNNAKKKNVKFGGATNNKLVTQKTKMQSSLDVVVFNNKESNDTKEQENRDEDNKINNKPLNMISSGTIIKATLVNGMDAPTMSQAKDNPLIAHMIITDLGILPNEYRYDVKKCFVLGEGYGDLSSERVYIRANNISCITDEGKHIDLPLKGYIAGEDGKIGMQGEVVYKQGAILARTLVAGFISGVAEGFESVGENIQITDAGVLRADEGKISTDKLAKKGAYKGVSKGADRLVDFYLKLADQVFPVIEIQAGRKVDIVVTKYRDVYSLEDKRKK